MRKLIFFGKNVSEMSYAIKYNDLISRHIWLTLKEEWKFIF